MINEKCTLTLYMSFIVNGTGAHKVQELEMLVSQYEADKSRLAGEIAELKREIGDKETQNTSFENRITQRNSQLIELQEQINHKCTEISNLEREVSYNSNTYTCIISYFHSGRGKYLGYFSF